MDRSSGNVAFIHEDASGGTSLVRLAKSACLQAQLYRSIESFLEVDHVADFGCAVLHETVPNDKAFQMLRECRGAFCETLPIILLSPTDNAESRSRARDLGAAGFFKEPVDGEALLDAIRWLFCITKNPGALGPDSARISPGKGGRH
tara:strand:- start:18701 stop:19141 length:441 start_codon:yes stop_codon:yes gene_type:complete